MVTVTAIQHLSIDGCVDLSGRPLMKFDMPDPHPMRRRALRGFAPMEVLLTIVILAFGLLGLLGMQSRMSNAEVEVSTRAGDAAGGGHGRPHAREPVWWQQRHRDRRAAQYAWRIGRRPT
jgi:hypothetical protein